MKPKTEIVDVHGLETEVFAWGDPERPKAFFFHGFRERGVTFQPLCRFLAETHHCIAPDFRGFGPRNWTKEELGYFYVEYIADMVSILDRYSPDEAVRLVGFSMGGNICSLFAGTFPDRVRSFVNMEGIGTPDIHFREAPDHLREWLDWSDSKLTRRTYGSTKAFAESLERKWKGLSSDDARVIAQYYLVDRGEGLERSYDPKHHKPNPHPFYLEERRAFWKKIKAPILLLRGERTDLKKYWSDAEDPENLIRERIDSFPSHARVEEIRGAEHQMHWEDPGQVCEKIRRFWNDAD